MSEEVLQQQFDINRIYISEIINIEINSRVNINTLAPLPSWVRARRVIRCVHCTLAPKFSYRELVSVCHSGSWDGDVTFIGSPPVPISLLTHSLCFFHLTSKFLRLQSSLVYL